MGVGIEVKILSGPRAGAIGTVVGYKGRSLIVKIKGYKDTTTVKASNVEAYNAPDWPQEGWTSWLP